MDEYINEQVIAADLTTEDTRAAGQVGALWLWRTVYGHVGQRDLGPAGNVLGAFAIITRNPDPNTTGPKP